jgi:hypothetical protein
VEEEESSRTAITGEQSHPQAQSATEQSGPARYSGKSPCCHLLALSGYRAANIEDLFLTSKKYHEFKV